MNALDDKITEIRTEIQRAEMDKQIAVGMKFSWLFYAFTFVVPLVYLITALRRRDRTMLWVGMGTTVLAVLTY